MLDQLTNEQTDYQGFMRIVTIARDDDTQETITWSRTTFILKINDTVKFKFKVRSVRRNLEGQSDYQQDGSDVGGGQSMGVTPV